MLRDDEMQIGKVYHNGKGMNRKVIQFWGGMQFDQPSTLPIGAEIEYVRCDKNGEPLGKSRKCWYFTFMQWAKGEVT